MREHYPYIISNNCELAIIKQTEDMQDFVYSLTAQEQQQCIILTRKGEYVDLSWQPCDGLSSDELTQRVTSYLAQEGHCCLAKLAKLTPEQAFALLAID